MMTSPDGPLPDETTTEDLMDAGSAADLEPTGDSTDIGDQRREAWQDDDPLAPDAERPVVLDDGTEP